MVRLTSTDAVDVSWKLLLTLLHRLETTHTDGECVLLTMDLMQ